MFSATYFAISWLRGSQNFSRIAGKMSIVKPVSDVLQRTPYIRANDVEEILDATREALDPEIAIQENRADICRMHQVLQVGINTADFIDLFFQLLVNGGQFFIERLKFLQTG